VILCENNTIKPSDLDLEIVLLHEQHDDFQLSDIEKNTIEKVLLKNENNISKSAEELGLSRAALYRRLEKYNIQTS
jgi:transcriptional regulator of acetoin/glycerol metabolism